MNKNPETWSTKLYDYRVRVETDEDPQNPRQEFDSAGYMVCWHREYYLGDGFNSRFEYKAKDEYSINPKALTPDEFYLALATRVVKAGYPQALLEANAAKIAHKHFIILPLYLYDHSGISMSTSKSYPFDCPWDAGQVGYIYFPKAKLAEEKWTEEQAVKYLQGEVETYDNYLTGSVYGFIIERQPLESDEDDWEEVESCWGFFGEVYEGAYDPQFYIDQDAETFAADAVGAGI